MTELRQGAEPEAETLGSGRERLAPGPHAGDARYAIGGDGLDSYRANWIYRALNNKLLSGSDYDAE